MAYQSQDLLDRLAALEREVRQLRGRAQMRPALNEVLNGTVLIGEGGDLDVRAPDGSQILGVGKFATGRYGVFMAREDGSGPAFEVGGNAPPLKQMARMFARGSYPNAIIMDDAYADGFLGRPSIPIPMQPTSSQGTSSTTPVLAWVGATRLMNPVLYAGFETYTPAGVTADLTFTADGVVVDSWVANTSGGWMLHELTKPVTGAFFDHVSYQLRHSVRSGTGEIRTNCLGVYTRNTFTPEEAP